jgi:radical SAM superfamily enzyme YgiQ (UPF0313 family)
MDAPNRRVLCVFPRYTRSFGTMHHAYPLIRGVKAFMPPQGILTVAAYLPKSWNVRFVDENMAPASDSDYRWADVVFVSGMHVQRDAIRKVIQRAHAFDKLAVLGGPSVSACPEWYHDADLLHLGELGNGTDSLIARLGASVARPADQERFATTERLPMTDFPLPAYHLLNLDQYFLASVQFSSGCPYRCEFCDIPELYGRQPRLKTPSQVTRELDVMLARGNPGAVYFVDDNFIANPQAALELLRELGRWQQERGYPVEFACEATLNLAQMPQALELMREAHFCTVFCGIETPDERTLAGIHKEQNLRMPMVEAVRTLNSYGLQVVAGIIIGFDTDTVETGARITDFIRAANIPMATVNLLHALPRTPLWRRLEAANRIVKSRERESNVEFLLPYETVVEMWLKCITELYAPDAIYERFEHQLQHTFPNRKVLPASKARVNAANVWKGLRILGRIFWHAGIRSDYRRRFWKTALPALRRGRIEGLINVAAVAHHMILFARECVRGEAEKCFYCENLAGPEETAARDVARPRTASAPIADVDAAY